jgi:signal transduction histidine kinase
MPDSPKLAENFLEQCPACHWLISVDSVFRRFFGDPAPLFGKPAADLIGRSLRVALGRDLANVWSGRFRRGLEGEVGLFRERRGATVWNVSVFPVRIDGEVCYTGGMACEMSAWNQAEQELRQTVLSTLKAQEFERKMAAKFLHDTVGQNLTALGLQLDLVRMDLDVVSPGACGRLSEIQTVLETIMEDVREYSYELNPSTVERAGLRSALDRLTGRIRERFTGSLRLNVDPSIKLDPKIAPALYQIAQEAIENAVKHSGCSAIEIAVKSTRNGPFLEVRDNGKGFDPADQLSGCRGLGLLSMEHYAAQAGLDLLIVSNEERGTTVRVAAPPTAS